MTVKRSQKEDIQTMRGHKEEDNQENPLPTKDVEGEIKVYPMPGRLVALFILILTSPTTIFL